MSTVAGGIGMIGQPALLLAVVEPSRGLATATIPLLKGLETNARQMQTMMRKRRKPAMG